MTNINIIVYNELKKTCVVVTKDGAHEVFYHNTAPAEIKYITTNIPCTEVIGCRKYWEF